MDRPRRPPLGGWAPHRTVTVVIPCYQGSEKLAITVAALDCQAYPSELLSVVVVDDGSDPPLRPPATHRVRPRWLVRNAAGSASPARNLGAELASGDILIFLDSDMIPEPQWAEAARWHHLVGDALTLGFRRHVEVSGWPPPMFGLRRSPARWPRFSPDGSSSGPSGSSSIWSGPATSHDLKPISSAGDRREPRVRRDTILELGGFDTGFDRWGAEDTELGTGRSPGGVARPRAGGGGNGTKASVRCPIPARPELSRNSDRSSPTSSPSPAFALGWRDVPTGYRWWWSGSTASGAAAGDVAGSVERVGSRLTTWWYRSPCLPSTPTLCGCDAGSREIPGC